MKRLVLRDFVVPIMVKTDRFRIRPLTIHDVVKDYDAVVTSREHLRATLPWDWPRDDLSLEQDLIDLAWHQKEFQIASSFAYTVVSPDETRVLGCIYIDAAGKAGYDVGVIFWVRADELDTGLEQALEATIRRWLAADWPFTTVGYPGRDLTWAEWDALPARTA
jgi:hypothetical protein